MARTASRTAEIIRDKMIMTTPNAVSNVALSIMDRIQGEKVHNQMLGMAAAFICMLELYELEHSEVLNQAHNYVYSGEFGNMTTDLKVIKNYMQQEWNL